MGSWDGCPGERRGLGRGSWTAGGTMALSRFSGHESAWPASQGVFCLILAQLQGNRCGVFCSMEVTSAGVVPGEHQIRRSKGRVLNWNQNIGF